MRALSPGINDPHAAISVLDRLGAALCDLVPLRLPSGVFLRENRVVLVVPHIDYDGLADTMFHMIRQNAAGSVAVPLRLLEVLTAVASVERARSALIHCGDTPISWLLMPNSRSRTSTTLVKFAAASRLSWPRVRTGRAARIADQMHDSFRFRRAAHFRFPIEPRTARRLRVGS